MSREMFPHPTGVRPQKATEAPTIVRASAILTAVRVATAVIQVDGARLLTLWLKATGGSSGGNIISLLPLIAPLGANGGDPPAVDSDVWYSPPAGPNAPSTGAPGGSAMSGADFSLSSDFGKTTSQPLEINFPLATSVAARRSENIYIPSAGWFCLQVADVGGGSPLATLEIAVSCCI